MTDHGTLVLADVTQEPWRKRVARLEDMAGKALSRLEQIPGDVVLPGGVIGLIMEAQVLLIAALRDETQK